MSPSSEDLSRNSTAVSASPKPHAGEKDGGEPTASPPSPALLKKQFVFKMVAICLAMTALFWVAVSWIFGSAYKTSSRVNGLNAVVVDFDQGSIGASLLAAVAAVNGKPTSFTYITLDPATTTPDAVNKLVFEGKYWAAIYANAGATVSWESAINGTLAGAYVPSRALTYVNVGTRFPTVQSSFVQSGLVAAVQGTIAAFGRSTVSPLLQQGRALSATAAQAAVQPIAAVPLDLAPMNFSTKALFSTIGTMIPIILQIIIVVVSTLMAAEVPFTWRFYLHYRAPLSVIWPLFSSLTIIGWFLTFSEGFKVDAKLFFALWALYFVYQKLLFDLFDGFFGLLPMPAVPPVLILFLLTSIAATAFPHQLQNNFYRVHWAWPSNAVFQTTFTIWGHGADNKLHITLPILAAWAVVAKGLALLAARKKVNAAKASKTE